MASLASALSICLILAGATRHASAQSAPYPDRRVTIVIGAAAGAGGDLMVRLLAQKLSDKWRQPVVIENKSGGSGLISAQEALKAPADGYTLYVSNDSPAINPSVKKHLPFDYGQVFSPISLLALIDFKLLVRRQLPVTSVAALIALARSQPGTLTFASAGAFTSHHLIGERFRAVAGLEVLHVPFRGAMPAVSSVASGETDYQFTGFTGTSSFIESGQLREIATTGARRNDASPALPTVGETLTGFSAYSWFAMWARSEVPAPIRAKISADVGALMKDPAIVERLRSLGMEAVGGTADELRLFVTQELEKWSVLPPNVREQD
jgi:tripartite-type tricarboxylate transporter receptor subunit TctC